MIKYDWLAEVSTLMWLVERRCDFSTNRTPSSAIRAEIALLWTNQIAGNTIDFKMNIIKDKIDGVFVIVNKLCYSTTRLLNEFFCDAVQKGSCRFRYPNRSIRQCRSKYGWCHERGRYNQCTAYTLSGLSTEIEGLKLNIIITELNLLSKVQSNNQAIEQIRYDLDSIKSQPSKSSFTSDRNMVPIINSESINVEPIANSTKVDSSATTPICEHFSKRSCAQLRPTVICQQKATHPK
jgi:hypothetical protein